MSQNHPILSLLWKIISSVMILVPLIDRDTGKSHLRSCDVINRFLSIHHDMMVLKTSKWYHCSPGQGASFGMQHDHTPQPHWWMTWPWPRVKFQIVSSNSNNTKKVTITTARSCLKFNEFCRIYMLTIVIVRPGAAIRHAHGPPHTQCGTVWHCGILTKWERTHFVAWPEVNLYVGHR